MKRKIGNYGVWLGIFMATFLVSCSSRRMVTDTRVSSDTLILVQHDTAYVASHSLRTDNVKERETRYVTIRVDSGRIDTVRVETVTDRLHTLYVSDSSRFFRQQADSLLQVMRNESQRVETTKARGQSKWRQRVGLILAFVFGVVMSLSLALLFHCWRRLFRRS